MADPPEHAPRTSKLYVANSKVIPIAPNAHFHVGRRHVQDLFGTGDLTISTHHLKFRCLVYEDDTETTVSPMVYVRVLSSNAVQMVPAGAEFRHRSSSIRKCDGDVLLNHGDRLKLTANLSILFQHDASHFVQGDVFTNTEAAEMKCFSDKYVVSNRALGWGGQATVYLAAKKEDGRQVACKIVRLTRGASIAASRLSRQERENEFQKAKQDALRQAEHVRRAVDILKELNHPNIVTLEKAIFTPKNIYIFEELITGGDLHSYAQQQGVLTEANAAVIIRQLLKAVEHLHDNNIAHRDIKPENVLMTSWREGARIVLTDFGQSRTITDSRLTGKTGGAQRMHTAVGTEGYAAPEVFGQRNDSQSSSGYSKAIDIWSIGCITAVLLTGIALFPSDDGRTSHSRSTKEELEWHLSVMDNGPAWINVGSKAKSFIKGCVMVDESQRFTAKQALMHVWFTNKSYAAEMEAAYRRAIKDWQPSPKRDPLVEFLDSSIAITKFAQSSHISRFAKEARSKFFQDQYRTAPMIIPGVLLTQPGTASRYRKPSPLPSVTQDAEMDNVEGAVLLAPSRVHNSPPDPTQISMSTHQQSIVDDMELGSHLSIEDFAPPNVPFTAVPRSPDLPPTLKSNVSMMHTQN